jgi:glutaredoxin
LVRPARLFFKFMPTKTCPHCHETKSTDEFYKNKSNPDGLQSYCKVCHNTCSAERKRRKGDLKPQEPQSAVQTLESEQNDHSAKLKAGKPQSRKLERYEIVRQVSSRTGSANWAVYDNRTGENSNSIIYVGDCLNDALEKIDELSAPAHRWS